MQGRLSPPIDGRIQSFPRESWQKEFAAAEEHGFRLLEWTLDQERLHENPLLTVAGQVDIRALSQRYGLVIPSLTGDCFMQAPFWKAQGGARQARELDFLRVVRACAVTGISIIVVPLVDDGRIENAHQQEILLAFFERHAGVLESDGLRVAFESDFNPVDLARLIARLDVSVFGINYDTGNSAALGFHPADEFAAYGHRILNVHIKDRLVGGTTVPLGTGDADFDAVFAALAQVGYTGNYILQTARAADGDHAGALSRYRDMTAGWLDRHGN